jgi:hypothetical protein
MRILGVLALLFVALLVVAILVVRSEFPPEKIQAELKHLLTETLMREASIGGVSPSLWPLGVSIRNVEIANHKDTVFSEQAFLQLDKIDVEIDLVALLAMQVRVKKIHLHGVSVLYEIAANGKTSIDGLGGEKKKETKIDTAVSEPLNLDSLKLPASFQLESFVISSSEIVYRDLAKGTEIILGNISQTINLELDTELRDIKTTGELVISELQIKDPRSGVKTGEVRIGLSHDLILDVKSQKLQINAIEASFQSASITLTGGIENFLQTPVFDIKIESNQIPIADLYKEIPKSISPELAKAKVAGYLKFNADVKGSMESQPEVNGKINLQQIVLSHQDVPAKIQEVNGNIIFSNDELKIEPFALKLDEHPISLGIHVTDLQGEPSLEQLHVNAKIDLAKLVALGKKLAPVPEDLKLSGLIQADIKASGKLDPKNPTALKLKGKVDLLGIEFQNKDLPDPAFVSGMVELSNTKIKQKLKVKIGPSDVTIVNEITDFLVMIFPKDAGNKKVRVKSSVKSANLELDRLMPPANPNKPEDPIPNSELPEFFPELPDNVILNANVSLGRTVFKHLTLKKFNMDIAFANKVVSQNLKALLYDGRILQSFQGDFKNTKNGLFTFKMKTKNVQANDLITNGNNNLTGETALEANLRNLDNTVYGKMNLDMNLKTFGTPRTIVNNLSGVIYSNLSNGEIKESAFINSFNEGIAKVPGMNSYTLKEMIFRKFDSEYEIREGQLIVKKLELKDSPIGYALLNGPIGFDGKLDLSLKHLMTPKMSKSILSSQKKTYRWTFFKFKS